MEKGKIKGYKNKTKANVSLEQTTKLHHDQEY